MTGLADGGISWYAPPSPPATGLGVHPRLFLQMPNAHANCNFYQSTCVRVIRGHGSGSFWPEST